MKTYPAKNQNARGWLQDYNYVRNDKDMNVDEEIKKYEKFGLIGRQNYGKIF